MPKLNNPKRKGFIWAAIFFAVGLFAVGGTVLGLTLYNTQYKTRRVASFLFDSWQLILTETLIWSLAAIGLATYTIWSAVRARKKDKIAAIIILLGHCIVLGSGIFLTLFLEKLYQLPDIHPQVLFKMTNQAIHAGRDEVQDPKFLPVWLDHIQKSSEKCCGVGTFHDWEAFWAPLKGNYPKSCCLFSRKNCTTVAADIVYPDLLGDNIKTDGGCYDEILFKAKCIILESKKFASILTVAVGISFAAVLALYVVVFFLKKPPRDPEDDDSDEGDEPPPAFDPADIDWRNLEFYNVFSRRKRRKKNKDNNDAGGVASMEPLPGNSSNLQQSNADQTYQMPPAEYRVDVLSPATVSAQPLQNDPPPQQSTQATNPNSPGQIQDFSLSDMGAGLPTTTLTQEYDDLQEGRNRINLGLLKKKHRHRHRNKDNQENDIDMFQN